MKWDELKHRQHQKLTQPVRREQNRDKERSRGARCYGCGRQRQAEGIVAKSSWGSHSSTSTAQNAQCGATKWQLEHTYVCMYVLYLWNVLYMGQAKAGCDETDLWQPPTHTHTYIAQWQKYKRAWSSKNKIAYTLSHTQTDAYKNLQKGAVHSLQQEVCVWERENEIDCVWE